MGQANWDFEGETAVVTGASSGIGRQIALELAWAGASIVVADIREEPAEPDAVPTADVIENSGGNGAFVETDVRHEEDQRAAIERAREFGGIDLMFNNAGMGSHESILEATREEFEHLFDVHVFGMITGCRLAAAEFLDQGIEGAIINTASIRSEFAHPSRVHYDSAKGAVKMLTRCAAIEFADYGIRVNAVAPGPIATHGREDSGPEEVREKIAEGDYTKPIPQSRAGEPEEVASAALYLASEEASYTTGELLFVDGGYQIY
jgi:NAD(P)-dependent dehydrogenase (short-subunit alcohol dehydrogenase family)